MRQVLETLQLLKERFRHVFFVPGVSRVLYYQTTPFWEGEKTEQKPKIWINTGPKLENRNLKYEDV